MEQRGREREREKAEERRERKQREGERRSRVRQRDRVERGEESLRESICTSVFYCGELIYFSFLFHL